MYNNRERSLLILIIIVILVAIPVTVWLVVNTAQLLDRRASTDTVTVNFIPPTIAPSLGDTYTVDIYLNSGAIAISAATISMTYDDTIESPHELQSLTFEVGENKPFTEAIYLDTEDPMTFTLLAERSDNDLASGSFKIATATFVATAGGTAELSAVPDRSKITGINPVSDNTSFAVASTASEITTAGTLCRVDACTVDTSIALVEHPRNDRKYNISATWDKVSGNATQLYFYKIYRSEDSAPTTPRDTSSLAAITTAQEFLDTNNLQGFEGASTVYYDIDTYIACPTNSNPPPSISPTTQPSPTGDLLL